MIYNWCNRRVKDSTLDRSSWHLHARARAHERAAAPAPPPSPSPQTGATLCDTAADIAQRHPDPYPHSHIELCLDGQPYYFAPHWRRQVDCRSINCLLVDPGVARYRIICTHTWHHTRLAVFSLNLSAWSSLPLESGARSRLLSGNLQPLVPPSILSPAYTSLGLAR